MKQTTRTSKAAGRKPASAPAGYSGTPLPRKLGIKPAMAVGTLRAPEGLAALLADLPEGAGLQDGALDAPLLLWFVRNRAELERRIARVAARPSGSVWMFWPKQSSPLATDLREQDLRSAGLARGLVDYKVCALDADWSGLLFTRRKETRK